MSEGASNAYGWICFNRIRDSNSDSVGVSVNRKELTDPSPWDLYWGDLIAWLDKDSQWAGPPPARPDSQIGPTIRIRHEDGTEEDAVLLCKHGCVDGTFKIP